MKKLSSVNESGIISQLNRHLSGKIERKCKISMEGVNNSHAFTDANGDTHYGGYGIINDGDSLTLRKLIKEIIDIRGYDCDLNDIDVSNIENFSNMFSASAKFKKDGKDVWNFSNLNKFKGDISGWDMSKAKTLNNMFSLSEFNGDISKWNVSGVTSMNEMFFEAAFNGDISEWDVSSVTEFKLAFFKSKFNGDISGWDVSGAKNMFAMFKYSDFSGDTSEWNVNIDAVVEGMFDKCGVKNRPKWYFKNVLK